MKSAIIVDDHPAICLAVRSVLEKSGRYAIIGETDNGQSVIELVREHKVDLIIIDLNIPRISGLELIKRIKGQHPGIKLLVLSAQDEMVYASRSMQAGADGFVSKSKDLNAILSASDAIMAGYSFSARCGIRAKLNVESQVDSRIEKLSDRELAVLQHLAQGCPTRTLPTGCSSATKSANHIIVNTQVLTQLVIANIGTNWDNSAELSFLLVLRHDD
jgi:DNA-binding NarL/FixJ family response regulator